MLLSEPYINGTSVRELLYMYGTTVTRAPVYEMYSNALYISEATWANFTISYWYALLPRVLFCVVS